HCGDKTFCRFYNKEVAEANFALHETHCSRFLCLCPDCDENVPQDQLSQHREEQHAQMPWRALRNTREHPDC
uniref:XIAP associated factor 1 n=1 Tax=Kryptolebias marmoratus TaxID=37003 RepID=A0A3Q3AX11_KRYMA